MPKTPQRDPLFTQRTTLIVLLALLTAIAAGLLSYWANPTPPTAILVAGAAFAATLTLLHQLID